MPNTRDNQEQPSDLASLTWLRRHPWLVLIAILLLALGLLLIFWALFPQRSPAWTGFGPTIDPATGLELPPKTLWDWLELLIAPAVLAGGAFWLNRSLRQREINLSAREKETDRQIAREARETERSVAADSRQQRSLEDYFDTMTRLLLDYNLRDQFEEGAEEPSIARTRTLAVLRNLDPDRKGQVIRFLHESQLINQANCLVKLAGANLQEVELESVNLQGIDIQSVNLQQAKLDGATISDANLAGANMRASGLQGADAQGAILRGVDLSGATLHSADFSTADITWADLSSADLRYANFSEANLAWAILKGAKCQFTIFKGADLRGAVLEDIDLGSASLQGARYNLDTVWSEDFDPEFAGLILDESPAAPA